jgi:hypothetical protein
VRLDVREVTLNGKRRTLIGHGIDRVDSSGGYTSGNVVGCCARCNFVKHDRNWKEFVLHAIAIAKRDEERGRLAAASMGVELPDGADMVAFDRALGASMRDIARQMADFNREMRLGSERE